MQLGHVGIWWSGIWPTDDAELADALARLHIQGYETVWSSGGFQSGLSPVFERLLSLNKRIKVASGIHNLWLTSPLETAKAAASLQERYPDRWLLGIGVSHSVLTESVGQRYERPYEKMVSYLDGLDATGEPAAQSDRRVLAALGPRMLGLAAARSLGAHPYFVPVEHTVRAREILGSDPVLAPEVAVLLETDTDRAREMARSYMELYLGLPNYTGNLRAFGFDEDDIKDGGSDRLVDAIVAWGDEAAIAARVRAHLEAGATHVCVQVLNGGYQNFPLAEYELLAPALFPL